MVKPQQPEIDGPDVRDVPEDNLPGHHPDHEQDKPAGRDFVAKTHALAQADEYEPPRAGDEVLDITHIEQPGRSTVDRALALAGTGVGLGMKVAGTSMKVAGSVYREVRKRLPYS
jgi:hypothetical protein